MKYIVYLTVNLINAKIYVGVRQTPNPEKFDGYIGCGVTSDIVAKSKTPTPFRNAVVKYGYTNFRRLTLAVFDTAEEAYYQESRIVNEKFILRKDTYNVSLGGKFSHKETVKIIQYTVDGKFLKVWMGVMEASRGIGAKSHSSITKCLKGKISTGNGFQWVYYKDDYPLVIPPVEAPLQNVPIVQYNLDGTLVKKWSILEHAAKSLNISSIKGRDIKRATQTKQACGGYQWRLFTDRYPETISTYICPRAVLQIDPKTQCIVKEWPSISAITKASYSRVNKRIYEDGMAHGFYWIKKIQYVQLDHDIVHN